MGEMVSRWPKDNQADLIAFYGAPKTAALESQLVDVVPPFRMTYDGKPIHAIKFHRKAALALAAALNEIWDAYGRDQAKIDAARASIYSGAYNPRLIRGSATKWSNHAYGAAIDIDAEHNGLNAGHGTMPQIVIDAFKHQGARWGGDYKGRTDPMHFEFCGDGEIATDLTATGANVFTNIVATYFGEAENSQVAYADVPRGWGARYGVALPDRLPAGPRPKVKVTNRATGKSVMCDIVDVGPWNTDDPYWQTGGRPQAESGIDRHGRPTNQAGIDLTPAAAQAIGLAGKGLVDWEFATAQPEPDILPPLLQTLPGQASQKFDNATLFRYIMENPSEAAQSLRFAIGVLNALHPGLAIQVAGTIPPVAPPDPVAPPPPPTPVLEKPGVGLGTLLTTLTSGLMAGGMLGTPFGMGAEPTTTGTLAMLGSLATTALGATGIWGQLAGVGIRLLGAGASRIVAANKK